MTTSETTTPSSTFSASSADLPTSPRVRRAKAFSSRSSASEPATSRTVTNISVIVAATEIAKVSRLGVSPLTTSLSTPIGWETEPSRSSATPRFSAASWLKLDHLVEVVDRAGCSGGSSSRTSLQDLARRARRPSTVEALAEEREVAAVEQDLQVARRDLGDLLGDPQVRLREQRVDPVVDEAALDRVLLVDQHPRRSAPRGQAAERLQLVDQVRRAGSARRAPRPTRPARGPPPRSRPGRTRSACRARCGRRRGRSPRRRSRTGCRSGPG